MPGSSSCDMFFWWFIRDLSRANRDLHLGDQKVSWKKLVDRYFKPYYWVDEHPP